MFYLEPPGTAPAIDPIEAPTRDEHEAHGVRTDVYPAGHEPAAWIWNDGAWRWASIHARHRHPDGAVELRVRMTSGMVPARELTYRWGPGIVLAHPGHRATDTARAGSRRS
ncbi:hypothetical protein [Streptomyces sp. NBC_01304]|uniref:hypothetical protein n=1 Tax=Streptomyces sp. NBC_01304 TaxID=2903818 RepID=UPI002E14213F|nr:hypothetical protein OG430_33520 [Streptomyces sp. NBC_01304]